MYLWHIYSSIHLFKVPPNTLATYCFTHRLSFVLFVLFFRFFSKVGFPHMRESMWHLSFCVQLIHSTWCSPVSSVLMQMIEFHSFFIQLDNSVCVCVCVSAYATWMLRYLCNKQSNDTIVLKYAGKRIPGCLFSGHLPESIFSYLIHCSWQILVTWYI